MKRLLREYPQEAQLLSVYFEEVALHQAKENERLEKEAQGSGDGGGSGGRRTRTNLGDVDFDVEESIGGDDEIDWHEAEKR